MYLIQQNVSNLYWPLITLVPGHVLDAIRLTEKYGKDPQTWNNNVDYYLLHKNEPLYYQDPLAKNGYCNGPQAYHYVERILEIYNNYKNIKQ